MNVMAASDKPVGMNHLTTVPENFDREGSTCTACGEPLDEDDE